MSVNSNWWTSPYSAQIARARLGVSVCTWTFSIVSSPTTAIESPSSSSLGSIERGSSSLPVTMQLVQ
jgi:hypothetical protein